MIHKKQPKVTDQDLADARLALALQIINSENAAEIVQALHKLSITQARQAEQLRKKDKRKAKQWARASDELFTVMMCAVYQKQAQMEGE